MTMNSTAGLKSIKVDLHITKEGNNGCLGGRKSTAWQQALENDQQYCQINAWFVINKLKHAKNAGMIQFLYWILCAKLHVYVYKKHWMY